MSRKELTEQTRNKNRKGIPNKGIKKAELPKIAEIIGPEAANLMARLIWLAYNADSHAVQKGSAEAALDRLYGRPAQAIQHTGKDEGPIKYSQQDARKELLERLEGMAGRQLVELKPAEICQIEDKNATTH